jgi:uncharacterized protein (DUF2147 family)
VRFEAMLSNVTRLSACLAAAAMLCAPGAAFAQAASAEGTWQTLQGTEVTIAPCESGYCGILSWIVIPKEHSAECAADKPGFESKMLDYQNPDQSLRTRSLIGMQMVTLRPTGNPNRYDIHIYDTERGKSYDGAAEIDGNTLNLQQCLGICVTVQSWPRVPTREGLPDVNCG